MKKTFARLSLAAGVFALGLVLLVGAGCGRAVNRSAERRVRDVLPGVIGPAREYRVHVENDPTRTVAGHLSAVTIDGDDIQLPNGMLLDRLHLELKGVDVDTRHQVLRSIRQAHFVATIGQATLDEFIAGESPDGESLRNTHILFGTNQQVTIRSERIVLGLGVPFELTGPLHLAGPRRLEIDARHLNVVGIPIAGRPLQFLKSRFENSIDVSRLPFPVTLTDVQTAPGTVTLFGDADVNEIVRRAQQR